MRKSCSKLSLVFDFANIGPTQQWLAGMVIESGAAVDNIAVYFDGLGASLGTADNCNGSPQRVDIPIISAANLGVCIYDSGYIQAC